MGAKCANIRAFAVRVYVNISAYMCMTQMKAINIRVRVRALARKPCMVCGHVDRCYLGTRTFRVRGTSAVDKALSPEKDVHMNL